ncbi:YolD-like family protein [Virgibacillus senegalensis]|uniref:YolD-like family protein n=1 Tax=Virgibacillus senegalensis TaxID=1499679 RepID=UPI00069DEA37|nr:YolD-like family protein [Virgibacillus senegalensis]
MHDKHQDRGTIKWTSLMLPEHVEMLNQWYEAEKDVEKPLLSSDKLEEMQRTITQAIEYKQKVSLFFYEAQRIERMEGFIKGAGMGKLEVENRDGIEFLPFEAITDVELIE